MDLTVTRNIYFYRIDAGRDDNGIQLLYDVKPVFEHINTIPFVSGGRYLEDPEGNAYAVWVDSMGSRPLARYGKVRRNGLPHIEQGGGLQGLELASDAGLAEQVHVVFFSNNIVGADYNFYGPRLPTLKGYIAEKAQKFGPPITFEPLVRQDILKQLNSLSDVRLFSLKTDVASAAILSDTSPDLGSVLDAAIKLGQSEEIEIVWRVKGKEKRSLASSLLTFAKAVAGHPERIANTSRLVVGGWSNEADKVDYVDVLKEYFIVKKTVLLMNARTRALDRQNAYSIIQETYDQIEPELLAAVGIRT